MPDAQFDDEIAPDEYIQRFLQEHTDSLKKILCTYVLRMGLASGANVRLVADEAFQDAVLEIVAHSERFLSVPQPRSWFLAVASNVLKRKRASFARRYRFEVLVSDLAIDPAQESEADLLEQLSASSISGPEQALEAREQVREIFAGRCTGLAPGPPARTGHCVPGARAGDQRGCGSRASASRLETVARGLEGGG